MKSLHRGFGLLIGFGIAILGLPTTARTTSPKETQTPAAGLQALTTDDARRAQELEIRRRHLTNDHADTATSYSNLARNLRTQGKYAQAQPLFAKALEIRRRLLTDDHPDTAAGYNNLATNLDAQGKYAQAQPLF